MFLVPKKPMFFGPFCCIAMSSCELGRDDGRRRRKKKHGTSVHAQIEGQIEGPRCRIPPAANDRQRALLTCRYSMSDGGLGIVSTAGAPPVPLTMESACEGRSSGPNSLLVARATPSAVPVRPPVPHLVVRNPCAGPHAAWAPTLGDRAEPAAHALKPRILALMRIALTPPESAKKAQRAGDGHVRAQAAPPLSSQPFPSRGGQELLSGGGGEAGAWSGCGRRAPGGVSDRAQESYRTRRARAMTLVSNV